MPGTACWCIPTRSWKTRRAREALKGDYALGEFVSQSANLALVLAGCHAGDAALVRAGLQDVLVEPRRAPLIAGFDAAKRAALQAGAMGASISGAGPSVFGWFETRTQAEAAVPAIQAAFAAAGFEQPGVGVADQQCGGEGALDLPSPTGARKGVQG